jgi:hypothetical protein
MCGEAVVRFETDSYQGMPSGMPVSAELETGFSRWARLSG